MHSDGNDGRREFFIRHNVIMRERILYYNDNVQHFPQDMHTDLKWYAYPYSSGLLHWHRDNITDCPRISKVPIPVASDPVSVKMFGWIKKIKHCHNTRRYVLSEGRFALFAGANNRCLCVAFFERLCGWMMRSVYCQQQASRSRKLVTCY